MRDPAGYIASALPETGGAAPDLAAENARLRRVLGTALDFLSEAAKVEEIRRANPILFAGSAAVIAAQIEVALFGFFAPAALAKDPPFLPLSTMPDEVRHGPDDVLVCGDDPYDGPDQVEWVDGEWVATGGKCDSGSGLGYEPTMYRLMPRHPNKP